MTPERRWAILVSLPVGYKGSQDVIPIAEEDGVTPLTFETEEEARAAATSSKYAPVLASIDHPWRIAAVTEPFPGYRPAEPALDLTAVYDNVVPMIHARCGDLASTPNPVMYTFIDACALQGATSMRDVPVDVARALWTQGLQALRDLGDAALDPSRQLDAVPRLGLERGFCPNLAVLAFQFWPTHEMCDGRPQKRHSYEPRVGVPRRLQVELRAHGCAPVIAEWKVLQRDGSVCAVPPPPQHLAGPVDLAPPKLPTALDVASSARRRAESIRRSIEEAKLASMQLPTFVVRPPPLRDFTGGVAWVDLGDSRRVTFREGDSGATRDFWGNSLGSVRLEAVNGRVVPTFYTSCTESDEGIWPIGEMLVVYNPPDGTDFRIVVIQPLKVVSSRP